MPKAHRIDVAEAAALIDAHLPAAPAQPVPVDDALGCILREPIRAERDQPPFHRVTMDGIALMSSALAAGRRQFRISGTQAAGAAGQLLGDEANCVEIMTGAMLPEDADTVVPVERITIVDGQAELQAGYVPEPGQFIHRRASDHAGGDTLLPPGTLIGPPEMAVLTIGGLSEVQVARWPRIAVISTGSELVDLGEPMEIFQIRSSNDRALAAALRRRGCPAPQRARLPDEPAALREAIRGLHEAHDVLVLSGGVSMGKFDYVPQIMEELGVELVFHKVKQRPGLPMWFGTSGEQKAVFALPGNPVSSLVCLVRYVCPALLKSLGAAGQAPPRVRLAEPVAFEPDLTWFLPVVLEHRENGELVAVPRATNTSGDFVALAGTQGVVELPRGRTEYPAGFAADFYAW